MKRYSFFSILLILPYILASCDSWLDVTPEDEIEEKDLFSSGEGFRNALNGIYKSLSESDLYGKELTWGLLDAMAQCYDNSKLLSAQSSGNLYRYRVPIYDYAHSDFTTVLEAIWSKAYNNVANANNIIQNIQYADEDMFESKAREKAMIEGEAYALRAFIHFDLLRMFAPAPTKNDQGTYIPYITEYPSIRAPKLSVDSCMTHVIQDLSRAQELVWKYDSSALQSRSGLMQLSQRLEGSGLGNDRFLRGRGYRMNYCAITGMLARAYLYAGKYNEAYTEALKIIKLQNSYSYFSYTTSSSYTANSFENGNTKAYNDIIVAFYSTKLSDWDKEMNDYMDASNNLIYMMLRNVDEIFGADMGDDYRYKFQMQSNNGNYRPIKYLGLNLSKNTVTINANLIPIMRMSEIYYIASEALCNMEGKLDEAKSYLMAVKKGRNLRNTDLSSVTTGDQLKDLIFQDARRELWGEGQLFFWYKRWDKTIPGASFTKDKFVIPVPESEIKI